MTKTPLLMALLIVAGLLSGVAGSPQSVQPNKISPNQADLFERQVRPLLLDNCSGCHGDKNTMGGLRLDSREAVLKGGQHGPALVPGDPDASALIKAIRYDGALKMPPAGKLSVAQISLLTAWVKAGAVWPATQSPPAAPAAPYKIPAEKKNFWSFRPLRKSLPPRVKNTAWVKTPVDAFILAKLEEKGLAPSTPADRRTLIRRATYDLTGLPPTPAEVAAFLADKSPNAYAKVVDRLLASPRYGERWGRHWLDVVRYCDSLDARGLGGEGDISEAWRYRDWVVQALNADMPYSQFILNQVAGDLLPSSSPGDLNRPGTIATGLLAIGNWGNGDADKEKILTDIADDQVDVVSRGFLGLTVACARCHDHKFDPISTKDYYGLAGIFFSTHILPKLTPKGAGETPLRIPLLTKAEKERRDRYQAQMTELERQDQAAREALATHLLPETARYLVAAWDYAHRPDAQAKLSLTDFATQHGLYGYALQQWSDTLGFGEYRLMTTPVRDLLNTPGVFAWKGPDDTPSATFNTTNMSHMLLTFTLPARSVAVHPGPKNGVVVGWKSPITGTLRLTGHVADADPAGGDGIAWIVDYRTAVEARELASGEFPNGGMQDFTQGKGAEHLASIAVREGDELQLLVLPKESHTCDTTVVQLTITETKTGRVWDLTHDLSDDPLQNGKGNPHADSYGNAGVWRFYDMANSNRARKPEAADPALLAWQQAVREASTSGDRSVIEKAAATYQQTFNLTDNRSPFWLRRPEDIATLPPTDRDHFQQIAMARKNLQKQAPPPIEYANGAQEGGVPESSQAGLHDVHVHIRGSYARLGDLVPRHFPVVLAGETQPPITNGSGRLELARWLASEKQPLTARVIVNRVWQHHFGDGIVRTPSNFGFLGERPTHPELLDWLAATFVAPAGKTDADGCGWSLKKLHRLLMLSSVYQQSATVSEKALKTDPDNRLLGRASRRRLEAEAIRDSLLAASGTLDLTMGGPAVRDFARPRRSLYIMTIRSDRTGFAPLFDAADSTASAERRVVSTVAPQALFLLNDPFALAQTQGLAKRLLAGPDKNDRQRIQRAYLLLYGRPASDAEVRIGLAFLGRMRSQPVVADTRPHPNLSPYQGEGLIEAQAHNSVPPPLFPAERTGVGAGSRRAYCRVPPKEELRAWEAYCQILLCANEFIYVD